MVAAKWVLEIPRPVPSANERHVNGRDRVSRAIYRKHRDAWAHDLVVAARAAGVPLANYTKRGVVLTRIMGPRQREYDHGNLVGGCKLVVDAMRPSRAAGAKLWVLGACLIHDDSPAWVSIEYRQERGNAPACRLEIWNE